MVASATARAVASTGPEILTVSGLSAERIVSLLIDSALPFSEVAAHRATLEEAYMELTRTAVEFRTPTLDEEAS